MTVSLLILFHAAIAYNTWGEANDIFFEPVRPIAFIVTFIDPWFMPMMFLLAGISFRFSLLCGGELERGLSGRRDETGIHISYGEVLGQR